MVSTSSDGFSCGYPIRQNLYVKNTDSRGDLTANQGLLTLVADSDAWLFFDHFACLFLLKVQVPLNPQA
jgi:hypothetical protein